MEDDQNGRLPKWKKTKMENDQIGRQSKWKTKLRFKADLSFAGFFYKKLVYKKPYPGKSKILRNF